MKGKEPKEWLQLGLIFLGLGLLGVLCWQAGQDILGTVHLSLAVFYGNVSYRAIVWVLFILVNGLLLVVLGLAALKVGPLAPNSSFLACLDSFRTRLGWARWVITVFLVMLPAVIILFVQKEDLIGAGALRMWILGMTAASFGIIFTRSRSQLIGWLPMLAGLLSTAVFFSFAVYMTRVIPYPFSMGWSEGNRLYDYSMIFGKERYSSRYPVEIPYYSPGRYALWGVAFLFPGLPIEIHRLWDGILWTIMPLLFGWFLTPRMPWKLRAGLAMWIALYLYQGPIYPMIFVSAILLSLAFRAQGMWKWLGTAAGSLYAGLSRWTWFSAVGVWGAILEQFKRPRKETNLIKRYVPAVLVFITGMVPGLLANAPRWLTPKESTLSLSQPLLWYRLFPNATYPQGILINLAVAVTPLVGFLAWLVTSRRWKPDWTQCLMILAACSAFLLAGLVASIKIGGGSNLHNLDMFFITLVFILIVALEEQVDFNSSGIQRWPAWVRAWITLAILMPAYIACSKGGPMVLPSQDLAEQYIEDIQHTVDVASLQGEVLFIDQRQLLTFGYIKNVNLVPDYEKKYMMDQAMAGNAPYFVQFYRDLASHRFSLIISDPLFLVEQGGDYSFGEENDAYVKWVSRPLLCYYEIKDTLTEVRVQYLVPRQGPPPADMECPVPSAVQ